jgi:hypothetical protein
VPGTLHESVSLFHLIESERSVYDRMNVICVQGPVKLLLHITAAHVNAVYRKAFPQDSQWIYLPVKSGQHADQTDTAADFSNLHGLGKGPAAKFEHQVGAYLRCFIPYQFLPIWTTSSPTSSTTPAPSDSGTSSWLTPITKV